MEDVQADVMPPKRGRSMRARTARGMSGAAPESKRTRLIGGFADTTVVTLRYDQRLALTVTSGVDQTYVFRGNGPYDPDATGTGGQPNNYDDWAVQYNRYRVISSRLRVTAINTTSNLLVCVLPANSAASITVDTASSRPRSVTKYLTSSAGSIIRWDLNYSTAQILGRTPAQVQADSNLQAQLNTTPNDPWYWTIVAQSADGTTTATGQFFVRIDYTMQWFDRIDEGLDLVTRALRCVKFFAETKAAKRNRLRVEAKSEGMALGGTGGDTGGKTHGAVETKTSVCDADPASGDVIAMLLSSSIGSQLLKQVCQSSAAKDSGKHTGAGAPEKAPAARRES